MRKIEAIDGLEQFLPNHSIIEDLILPVVEGGVDADVQLHKVATVVWENMNLRKSFLKNVGLPAKKCFYEDGNYIRRGKRDFLILDLDGEDSDITLEAIKDRLSRFLSMRYEYDLAKTLKELGYEVRHSTEFEDKVLKIDLLIKLDQEVLGVSVFKSDMEMALRKLRMRKTQDGHRVFFQIQNGPFNPALDKLAVWQWMEEVKQGQHQFILKNNTWEVA